MVKKIRSSARVIINQCLGIKRGERVVIIVDRPCRRIGEALWNELPDRSSSILIEIEPTGIHGKEPPPIIAEILKRCDAFIIPTSFSLTHTRARIEATKMGVRGATMPGITLSVMARTLNADYHKIAQITEKMAGLLTAAKKVTIKTADDYELHLDIESRPGHPDTGIITEPGSFSNLPAGEAYCAPVEGNSEGKVVIDGSFAPIGLLKKPVELIIKAGRIVGIKGSNKLTEIFKKAPESGRILCELGIGTNYRARITGNVLEDEKVMGTVHIAFGNNLGFGGKNDAPLHLDGVIRRPVVWFDEKLVIERGKILV
ncbi:MAG: aminopeptidase [candidate division WOR-3 bacterium]